MEHRVLLISPPFVQMNTPYPSTAYIKGFLNTQNISSFQLDLGLEVILKIFTKAGLQEIFEIAQSKVTDDTNENLKRIISLRHQYWNTIDAVILFLQNKNNTLAHLICTGNYLPEASRFDQIADLEWAFGNMGINDKARHLATLYLEDIGDLITELVDEDFGFSRYAERISSAASTFDAIHDKVEGVTPFIVQQSISILQTVIDREQPTLIAISIPFPGNLFAGLACSKWIKKNYPHIKIAMGGGYPNTELRSLTDPRIFKYIDCITLDDGEAPLMHLLEWMEGKRTFDFLKRTFILLEGKVFFANGSFAPDFKQSEVGAPDYTDLHLTEYLSVIELANPMHRLWNDGRWNKLTLAHGCYWGKCTFCDISLDYIKNYEATTAIMLVDRMEQLIAQTGESGFHFVDEAAPPALMRDVAIEILRRGITVIWWANIRFEKNFTADICRLFAASGCIAISGGLEVASDRLLKLIDKGITVAQVAKVTDNFTQSGIMVHAYLMYGFPTQTAQETIDSLEMVRQLFEAGVVQSGFWHQFAMTAHSPIGMHPELFKVEKVEKELAPFANNDLKHIDPLGTQHGRFSEGLRKSLFNYMHGICFEYEMQEWFSHKVPKTTIPKKYISQAIANSTPFVPNAATKLLWLGVLPTERDIEKQGNVFALFVQNKHEAKWIADLSEQEVQWLLVVLNHIHYTQSTRWTFKEMKSAFESEMNTDFSACWNTKIWPELSVVGLLVF